MALHKIRSTHRPEKEMEVDDAELTDLTRMGMVLDTKATTEEGARKAAEAVVASSPAKKAAPRKRSASKKSTAPADQGQQETGESPSGDSASNTDEKEG